MNAKGTSVRNPDDEPDKFDPRRKHAYILSIIEGNVSVLDVPAADKLQASTDEVLKNNRLDVLAHAAENPLAGIGLASGKIKHVIYIIKENRTYDEVLGDIPQGNGDPSLVLFGREVTPNQHALAERFVLLDNLYACGEVSGDGWCWSTQGMATAYASRNVPYNYSRRGRVFDFEGTNNGYPTAGFPAKGPDGKPLATDPKFKDGAPAVPDVANTGRNIWDAVNEAERFAAQLRLLPVHHRQSGRHQRRARQLSHCRWAATGGSRFGGRHQHRLPLLRSELSRQRCTGHLLQADRRQELSVRKNRVRQVRIAQPVCGMESRIPDDAGQRSHRRRGAGVHADSPADGSRRRRPARASIRPVRAMPITITAWGKSSRRSATARFGPARQFV